MPRKTQKQTLIQECEAVGLSANGTVQVLQARLDAFAEAGADTAAAVNAPRPKYARRARRLDPGHAVAAGVGVGLVAKAVGWL